MNRFCEIFNVEKPIICGPMAWVSTAPLVGAVSNAGGLGILGVGFATADFVEQQIKETREITDKPFGINVVMIPGMLDHVTAIVQKEKPPVVYADTIIGLDYDMCKKYFDLWHEAGAKIIVKASIISDAVIAEKAGVDAVIVKGWEGGGHTTFEASTVLIPQAADLLSVPVIGSGGIADGRGMAAAIALGADAIEMGTVFMAAKETAIHPNAKQAVVEAKDFETVITGTCTGEPCRQIKNVLSDKMLELEANYSYEIANDKLKEIAASSLKNAMVNGDMENGAVMAGQIAPLVKEIKPVQQIIDETLEGCKKTIQQMQKYEF
ncbi:MAG: nitronate monooxygenase [Erysipelotrichaceae bacterium]|nr:nitronate monooxygenase [Erysipelotrichaceae bacterium]